MVSATSVRAKRCCSRLCRIGLAMVGLAFALEGALADDALRQGNDPAVLGLRAELRAVPHKILYEAYDSDNWDLFIMNADGSGKRNLTHTPDVHEFYPQASPDGARICFIADVCADGNTLRGVHYMKADGSGRTLVAEKARQPCWSPDGTKIAFVNQEFSRFNIKDFASKGLYFYDLATGETTAHPNPEVFHLYTPAWSADGRWMVSTVHAGMGYSHAIIAIEFAGLGVHDLKLPGCRPCLSADGTAIVWGADDHRLAAARIDFGGVPPRVSNEWTVAEDETLHLYHADFSPDARYVTYSVGPGGRMAANGSGTHTEVAEMVGVRGPWNLYLKRANGEGPAIQLTEDASMSNKESEWLPVLDAGENTR